MLKNTNQLQMTSFPIMQLSQCNGSASKDTLTFFLKSGAITFVLPYEFVLDL